MSQPTSRFKLVFVTYFNLNVKKGQIIPTKPYIST